MRYRSRPTETVYVEAVKDVANNAFYVQHVNRDGTPTDPPLLEKISEDEFNRRFEPVVRAPKKPRGRSDGQQQSIRGGGKPQK